MDKYEVVQGSFVSYDRLYLQAELPVRLAIPLNVFQCVFQFDAVALQKGIDFQPGVVTQQLAELGSPKSYVRSTLLGSGPQWSRGTYLDQGQPEPLRVASAATKAGNHHARSEMETLLNDLS